MTETLTELTEPQRLFLEALRSGEFPQAAGLLRSTDGWCCLGVATEVYRRVTGNGRWSFVPYHVPPGAGHYIFRWLNGGMEDGESVYLPPPVAAWLDLADYNPKMLPPAGSAGWPSPAGIAFFNDDGVDFSTIADMFEGHFTGARRYDSSEEDIDS